MTDAYDEFGLFHENASEFGLKWTGPPTVRRTSMEVGDSGRRISGLQWGNEPPELVFIHGTSMNAHTWDTVILALGRPALALDLPGHGHSSWRDDASYTPANLAVDVAAGVAEWAPTARAVIGMSLGGLTSVCLATDRPDLVRKLVVVDITPGTNRQKAKAIMDFVDGPQTFPNFDDLLAYTVQHNPTRSASSLRRGLLHNARSLPDGTWAWRWHRAGRTQSDHVSDVDGTVRPDNEAMWDRFAAVACPLLLVQGEVSPVVDDADLVELRRRCPDVEVVVIDGAGHSVQGDRPIELSAAIERFVYD